MAELAGARWLLGPLSGAGLFLLLAGGRVPRAASLRPRGAFAVRWASLGLGAALEEAVWRGLVLAGLASAVGPPAALGLSTVGFAVWHWRALGRRCSVHLVTGATFGAAFLAGGLPAAILSHAVYNVLVDWAVHADPAGRAT